MKLGLKSLHMLGNTSYLSNLWPFSREKKLLVGSDDFGRDLTGVQNLRKKHKRLEAELSSHEPAIQNVQDIGEKLMAESNLMNDEIQQRLQVSGYIYLNRQMIYEGN